MLDFSSVETEKDFLNIIEASLKLSIPLIKDAKIVNMTEIQPSIIQLLKSGMYIYDFNINSRTINSSDNNNITESITRTYIFAFVKLNIVEQFAKLLSQNDIIIGIHNHITGKSHIYMKNKKKKWTNEKFIISYDLVYDNLGNPDINNEEYIWDYSSDIYELVDMFKSDNIKNILLNDYVQVSILNNNFNTDCQIIPLAMDILSQVI